MMCADSVYKEKDFFANLHRHKTYKFAPIKVVNYEDEWFITHEFDEIDVQEIFRMEKVGTRISFADAYRARWFERARQDSSGKWFLISTISIRTPIWQWAKERGMYIEFEEGDFELQNVVNLV